MIEAVNLISLEINKLMKQLRSEELHPDCNNNVVKDLKEKIKQLRLIREELENL